MNGGMEIRNMKYEIRNTKYEIRKDVEMCCFADVRPSAYVEILDGLFYLYTFIFCLELMWKCGKRD